MCKIPDASLQAASTEFVPQAPWTVPLLYDAVYLYMMLASKMLADGLDFTNGSLMLQKAFDYNIKFIG